MTHPLVIRPGVVLRAVSPAATTTGSRATGRSLGMVALAALMLAGFVGFCLWLRFPKSDQEYWGTFNLFVDLHVYRWGGDHVLHHLNLYPGRIMSLEPGEEFRGPMTFTYTPFAAVAFVPLALVGIRAMEFLWMAASLAAMAAVVWWMFRWLGYEANRRLAVGTVALCGAMLFVEPVRTTLWMGQINLFLLALVTFDAASPRSRLGRGIGTGIAAGVKLTPAFLWAYFLVTRQWRTLVVSVATFAATVAVGAAVAFRDSTFYWTGGFFESNRVGVMDLSSNQSLNGMVAFFVFHSAHPPGWAWLVVAVPAAVLGLAAVWLLHRAGHEPLAFVLAGMTGAAVSPFSWGHHWVWFVPLFVVLVDACLRSRRWLGRAGLAAVLVVLYFLVGAWVHRFPSPMEPDGEWVGVGWFMSPRAFAGPFLAVFRETHLIVWAATLLAAPVIALRFPRRPPAASGWPWTRLRLARGRRRAPTPPVHRRHD